MCPKIREKKRLGTKSGYQNGYQNGHFDTKNLFNLNMHLKLFLLNPFNMPNIIELYELYKSPYCIEFKK